MILTSLLIVIYLCFVSLGLPDSLLGSAWPSMYKSLNVPISSVGILSMIVAGGTIVSSFFSGKISKHFRTEVITAVSVFMTTVALFGFSTNNNFMILCLFAIPLGLGAGSVDAALNNYIALHYKAKHMSWMHCFWGIGTTIGPIIMAHYLKNGGTWNLGYRTISFLQLSLFLILLAALPLWKKVKDDSLQSEENKKNSLKLSELLKLPGAKPGLITFFCYCALESTAGLWGSSFMVIVKDIPVEKAAKIISIFYFGITFGRFLSGFLTLRLNHHTLIRMGQAILAMGVVILLIPFGYISLLLGFFLVGLGCAPIYPSLLHETPINFGSDNSQAIMGIQMACAYVGSTFMPPIFGVIASFISYQLFPIYLGMLLLLMFITVERLNKKVLESKENNYHNKIG